MPFRTVLAVAMAMALSALAGPVLAIAGSGANGGVVVVVSAPDAGARASLIRSAGGAPVGPVQSAFAGFASSPDPDFAERLRAGGAWLVLDGDRLASICGLDP